MLSYLTLIPITPCHPPTPNKHTPTHTPQGFISAQHNNLLVSSDPEELLQLLQQWQPPASNVLADAATRMAAVGQDIGGGSDGA